MFFFLFLFGLFCFVLGEGGWWWWWICGVLMFWLVGEGEFVSFLRPLVGNLYWFIASIDDATS